MLCKWCALSGYLKEFLEQDMDSNVSTLHYCLKNSALDREMVQHIYKYPSCHCTQSLVCACVCVDTGGRRGGIIPRGAGHA